MGEIKLSAPKLLSDDHRLDTFDCGEESLNEWLRRKARSNQLSGASRTYVTCRGADVVGYYCISSGALAAEAAPGSLRRNMPDPIPMTILGRFAIDQDWQGRGVGVALLQDAVTRAGQAAEIIGVRGILVHALSDRARLFYEKHGFRAARGSPMTLVLSLKRRTFQIPE
ncbi:GNAT family N-acetyltransferase [Rhizobium sp. CC-YZS058]|uniref:GNAT family N-acetyltransferase n=1 Tax=Rhizobium sp. CC-YZS058 TaxID=3042153 RepID=UPI002B053343|nr:GNAT family N-acetyltransferase [Rhizobium sp. CC-YZS058]MEA3535268.1 GNAT family N-acetyltransferase [Rhizobium sp. CC-YZS058]